jgi:hypothetical protein
MKCKCRVCGGFNLKHKTRFDESNLLRLTHVSGYKLVTCLDKPHRLSGCTSLPPKCMLKIQDDVSLLDFALYSPNHEKTLGPVSMAFANLDF